jgi:hypothetical protein
MKKHVARALGPLCALLLAACGGGSGGGVAAPSASTDAPATSTAANALPVAVDAGPAELASAGGPAVNALYASVTLCTPGSTTACQTIDHVEVDTGSSGLRIIASALDGSALPQALADPASGSPLRECMQFADGYTWGSVVIADVRIAGRTVSSLPIHLIGDPAAGAAPLSCVSGPDESTVLAFGSKGVLGVGNFLQDCGSACASRALSGAYYVCPPGNGATSCGATAVPLDRQVANPIAALGGDSNGVVIALPAIASPGARSASGTLYFGIGTQADNALGNARLFTLDDFGTLVTTFDGVSHSGSFVDSGSNGYFFTTASLPVCLGDAGFYCPATASGAPASATESAAILGSNGATSTVTFTVDNADALFASNDAALPGLAGPNAPAAVGVSSAFDWGLPFFFGRSVYVLFEGNSLKGVTGPAVGF